MTPRQKLDLIHQAIIDWLWDNMDDDKALLIIGQIVGDQKPTPECEKWAKEAAERMEA